MSYGLAATETFLKANNFLCIVRAHAVQEEGYFEHFVESQIHKEALSSSHHKGVEPSSEEIDAAIAAQKGSRMPPVITVFSAPNYCNRYTNR